MALTDSEGFLTEGWAFPGQARGAHYMILQNRLPEDRISFSICGKYGFFTSKYAIEAGIEAPSEKDDCKPCTKKVEARKKALAAAGLL